jgi:hypothetical protein
VIREIKHFSLPEFKCGCGGCVGIEKVKVAAGLVFWLEIIRLIVKSPLVINSGHRCLSHNAKVGGKAASRHLIGCAADVAYPVSFRRDEFLSLVSSLRGVDWEFIPYANFFHMAMPRACERHLWDGGGIFVNHAQT